MKISMICAAAAIAAASPAAASPAPAQSPFDGTWKLDVSSAKLSAKPSVWMIKDGVYTCSSCTPRIRVPADGKPHPVAGQDYWDTLSVQVVDPKTVHYVYARAGKTVTDATETLGAGGNTLTNSWTDYDNAKGEALPGKGVMTRAAAAPAGAHANSGGWRRTNDFQLSDQAMTLTLKRTGNRLTMVSPTGESYTATIGGAMAPIKGDHANTMVAVRQGGPGTLVETDYRKGKPVSRTTMTPMPGGKTMKIVNTDLIANRTNEFTVVRQ